MNKTPISYYGGKQSMLKHILPLIPIHTTYVEPFFGGGAVFFAKPISKFEVINDYNGNVVNFYLELKNNYLELKKLVEATPYSREVYKQALTIYHSPYIFTPVHRAWAFWVCTSQGFSNKVGSWRSSGATSKEVQMLENKKMSFTEELSTRLNLVQIECKDATDLIKKLDAPETFFYVDPPYVDSNQGHYGGYTQEHFNNLLDLLSKVQGKFLLSSYPNTALADYSKKSNWTTKNIEMNLSASQVSGRKKVEVLTSNF